MGQYDFKLQVLHLRPGMLQDASQVELQGYFDVAQQVLQEEIESLKGDPGVSQAAGKLVTMAAIAVDGVINEFKRRGLPDPMEALRAESRKAGKLLDPKGEGDDWYKSFTEEINKRARRT